MATPLAKSTRRMKDLEMSTAPRRVDVKPAPSGNVQRADRGRILDAMLFLTAVDREQKRVDRSDKAFAVVAIELTDGHSAELMREAASAISMNTRGGDVIGWLEQ